MGSIMKKVLVILLMVAVLVYTVINYIRGEQGLTFLVVAFLMIGFPLVNITRMLIDEIRNK